MATTLGFVEFLVEWYFLPHTKVISITTYAGIVPYIPGITSDPSRFQASGCWLSVNSSGVPQ